MPHSRLLTANRSADFRQLPPAMSAPVCRTWPSGCCQTEAHQRKRGTAMATVYVVTAGSGESYRIERVYLDSDQAYGFAQDYNGIAPGGAGSGGGMAGRCPAGRLRRPVLAGGVVGADAGRQASRRSCGTPTRANGSTTSPSARSGGPATRCRRPRWCAGNWPGCPRSRWSGRSKEKVEELFWDTVTQVRAELAGVPRK